MIILLIILWGAQIETETQSNRSKPKRLRDNKLGPARVLGPAYQINIETEIPNHVEIRWIAARPTLLMGLTQPGAHLQGGFRERFQMFISAMKFNTDAKDKRAWENDRGSILQTKGDSAGSISLPLSLSPSLPLSLSIYIYIYTYINMYIYIYI